MKPGFEFTDPLQLRQIINGFQVSRIIPTAYEVDVFTHIKPGGSSSDFVAEQINTDARATDRLMNALCAYRDWETDRKSTRLNSSHSAKSRMPSSA